MLPAYCDTGHCDKLLFVTVVVNNKRSKRTILYCKIIGYCDIVTLFSGPNSVTISGKHCTVHTAYSVIGYSVKSDIVSTLEWYGIPYTNNERHSELVRPFLRQSLHLRGR